MAKTLVMMFLLLVAFWTASVAAEQNQFSPLVGTWVYDSTRSTRCPCTIVIKSVGLDGAVEGDYTSARGQHALTGKAEKKGGRVTFDLGLVAGTGGANFDGKMSEDGQELSGIFYTFYGTPRRTSSSLRDYKRLPPQQATVAGQ